MRSELVYPAVRNLPNRYLLCQVASKATRKFHRPNTRVQDTMNQILEKFAQCQVQKVFKAVCLRDAVDQDDRNQVAAMTNTFRNGGYNLKQVFAESAGYCMGN